MPADRAGTRAPAWGHALARGAARSNLPRGTRARAWGHALARGAVAGSLVGAVLTFSFICALWAYSWSVDVPAELLAPSDTSSRILDRDGRMLARTMADGHVFHQTTTLRDAGPFLPEAIVAAEDARFFQHSGVDWMAVARALAQAAWHGKVVSGASTLTQQLARQTFERPRTLGGKWQELARALAIERRFDKDQILELYLGRVHFGSNLVGAAAAADHYFGKPLGALDLSESATLAALVRGPSIFDPRRHPERARVERDRVLARMQRKGVISFEQASRARALTVELHPRPPLPGAEHWVRVVQRVSQAERIRTTLDGPLQREVEALVAEHRRQLSSATAAAAVVLDNATGEVLSYVGSPDFEAEGDGGQNDGVQALRQPGSTLKPLIYALAIDELNFTPATLLPDTPQHFATAAGYYAPRNYDRRFRGEVRLRRALANSLNVPAVFTVQKLGVDRTLDTLRSLGLHALQASAEHYGPALALGDGEVTLLQLTSTYAALARGGQPITPRLLLTEQSRPAPSLSARPALSPTACALVLEMLSDDAARREAFGSKNALELPFPVAVKTGTSKGHRDSWTVGTTRELSVGVWVGNFDGRPTDHLSGAVGAAPLFHQILKTAVAARERAGLPIGAPLHDLPLRPVTICVDSGRPAHEEPCDRTLLEWFPPDLAAPSSADASFARDDSRISFPRQGMVFDLDPALAREQQRIVFQTHEAAQLYLNGEALGAEADAKEWALEPGRHRLEACVPVGGEVTCDVVSFTVRARS